MYNIDITYIQRENINTQLVYISQECSHIGPTVLSLVMSMSFFLIIKNMTVIYLLSIFTYVVLAFKISHLKILKYSALNVPTNFENQWHEN